MVFAWFKNVALTDGSLQISQVIRARNLKHEKFCLFVLEFYGPVNNKVMSSRSVNSGTVLGQAYTF